MVAAMLEEAQCISAANRIQRNPYGFDQCLVRASLSFAQDRLYLREGFFYGEKSGE
jgi:hypothetical protein